SRAQIERAVDVALVASFPVAFYGVIQHYALDPLSWPHGAAPGRVTSTIGNPAFLGAYLILVIPLTLMRLIAQTGQVAGHVDSAKCFQEDSAASGPHPPAPSPAAAGEGEQGCRKNNLEAFRRRVALYGGVVVSCL